MIDRYAWRGGSEAMLRFGPASGAVALVAAPPFEEANRTRAFLVALCRALGDRGVASALPDLPGTGESLVATETARLADWRAAFAAAGDQLAGNTRRVFVLALRGGALFDTGERKWPRYHISPRDGASLVRDLVRVRLAGARESGERFDATAIARPGAPIELAGNYVSRELLAELQTALSVTGDRIVRLASDPLPADLKLDAAPLWRRAEPGQDLALAARLADDVAAWPPACGG